MTTAAIIIKYLPSTIRAACRKTTASFESSSPPVRRFAFQRSVVGTLLFSFFALTLLFLSTTNASATTWYIKADGTGDAPTIQAGVDSAAVGDTVLVGPGIYSDTLQIMIDNEPKVVNVHIDKNIKLIAEGSALNTTIEGANSDIAIYVEKVDSTGVIKGFRINTTFAPYGCVLTMHEMQLLSYVSKKQPDFDTAIMCTSSSIKILKNELTDNGYAIRLHHSHAIIVENEIGHSYFGVVCWDSSHAEIVNNKLYDCAELIECVDSDPTIRNNKLFSQNDLVCGGISCSNSSAYISGNHIQSINNDGLLIQNSDPTIEYNHIEESSNGMTIIGGNSSIIRSNLFNNNGTAIEFIITSNSTVENNTIVNSGTAIFCQTSSPELRNNIIFQAAYGIACVLSFLPVIECNNIYDADHRYAGNCSDQTGVNGNISVDPEFCGIEGSGNYYLQYDSPCAPGKHPDGYDCGLIGAFGVSCGTDPVTQKTWGIIKSLYKGKTLDSLRGGKQ